MIDTIIGTDLSYAVSLLKQNELVAIPTETVYGLAANALETEAVIKIFETKNRPFFNPLILHVSSINEIDNYAYLNEMSLKLANFFMPGPFTLLLNKKEIVPDLVTAGSSKVAIRIPNHPLTKELLSKLKFPLAAPSANPFGYVSPVSASHVLQGLNGKIKYILDGGICNVGIESTIIEIENDNVIIHRVGGLAIEVIESVIGKKIIYANNNKPQTSGQLKSHYATNTDLIQGNIDELFIENRNKKIAVITFKKLYSQLDFAHQFVLSKSGDINEAAKNLFSAMRKIDELNYDLILAEVFPNLGLGIAINDRLSRAQFINKD